MARTQNTRRTALMLGVAAFGLTTLSAYPGTASAPTTPTTGTVSAVTIQNFSFQPANITVKPGTTVVWTNKDPVPHTVTADNGAFGSSRFNTGGTYSHTFTQVGTYPYHCMPHPQMKGTVTVQ